MYIKSFSISNWTLFYLSQAMIIHLVFTIISHHLLSNVFTSSPSPLCRRLEAFSQSPFQSSFDLKMFSLHQRLLYLIDEVDDLYVLTISEQTANWLYLREELPLWTSWDDDNGQPQSWIQPVGKWYNHPWLRMDFVNSPLAKLQLFTDRSGTLWRQYLFLNGQHFLVNNRTGGREVMFNFRDFLIINNKRNFGDLLFHYDNYSWLRSSKLSVKDRRVVVRPRFKWKQFKFLKRRSFNLITNAHRSAFYLSNLNNTASNDDDLFLKLPLGGFIADQDPKTVQKLFLLTEKFTREVVIVKDIQFLQRNNAAEQKWKVIQTKPWSSFFQCHPKIFQKYNKAVHQSDYREVASMLVDDRQFPGAIWAMVSANAIACLVVFSGCFIVHYPRRSKTNDQKPSSGTTNSNSESCNFTSSQNFSPPSSPSSLPPLDRKSKLRLIELIRDKKRSSKSCSNKLNSLQLSEPTSIKSLDCSSVESINLAINKR